MSPVNASKGGAPPLHERKIKDVPALSEQFAEKKLVSKYYPFPENGTSISIDQWLTDIKYFNLDLEWMLQLEYHRFWSTMIFKKHCIDALASFLQEAVPFYTPITTKTTNQEIKNLYTNTLKNVMTVICRLITPKESETEWMPKEKLGELIYSKYLISIPMIFDLLVAYGRPNLEVLSKVLQTLFKLQPNYKQDLKNGVAILQSSFKDITNQLETFHEDCIESTNALNLPSLELLALYALDCAATLQLLLEVYPDARGFCHELNIPASISAFYENGIPLLYKYISDFDQESVGLKHLNCVRVEMLNSFHAIVNFHLENLLKGENEEKSNSAEALMATLGESLENLTFAVDYQKRFPVEMELDIIRQGCPNVNAVRVDYLQNAYAEAHKQENVPKSFGEQFKQWNGAEQNGYEEKKPSQKKEPTPDKPVSEEEQSKQILDVFPDFGEGFVRKLLARYEGNVPAVISAVLEGNLPPDLEKADRHEPYIPPEKEAEFFVETGIKRLNIYDGDEFDVMVNDNVKGIHKKGKDKPTWDAVLEDKSVIKQLKSRYQELGYVDENEYSDEYDDSYDAMAESEAKTVRFSAAKNVVVDSSSDSAEEEEPSTTEGRKFDSSKDFCENPETVRARYEQRRQAKFGGPRGRGGGGNVVGKPKGQGQDQETTASRQKKNVHKATGANHNRKQGSTWKRGRGMF